MRVLGVTFDYRFGFRKYICGLVERPKIRMGILTEVAGSTWGARVGVLRLTGKTLLVGLVGYRLVTFGSSAYDPDLMQIGTCIINPTAPRVVGPGRSARLPVLLATAGLRSVQNAYLQQSATTLDAVLRAYGTSVLKRILSSTTFFCSYGYRCDALHTNIFRSPRLKKGIR